MPIYHSVTELIGRTPLLELCNYERNHDLKAVLLAKLECMNPAGSAKDRVAANMIARAETEGRLAPGGTIIEPTSGNTGIGLAAAAAAKGYRVILTMPDTMSVERRALIAAYGAEIILTPGAAGMAGVLWPRRKNCISPFPAASSQDSLKTPPIQRHTRRPPALRSGRTRRGRWTSLWPGSAPAALSAAWAGI